MINISTPSLGACGQVGWILPTLDRKLEKAFGLIITEVGNDNIKMLTTLILNLGLFGKSLQTSKRDG